jgi:hypothetical protein
MKILPKVFKKSVRISTILTLMAYNDFAYSLESGHRQILEVVADRAETVMNSISPIPPVHNHPPQPPISHEV